MEINKIYNKINEIAIKKNIDSWVYINKYLLSTYWLSFPMHKLENKTMTFFIFDIVDIFKIKKYPSLSIVYLILDSDLKKEVKQVFKNYELDFEYFFDIHNKNNFFDYIDDEFLCDIANKNSLLHSHLVINIMLLNISSSIYEIKMNLNNFLASVKKYSVNSKNGDIFKLATIARSLIMAFLNQDFFSGYTLGEAYVLEMATKKELIPSMKKNLKFVEADKIDINNINILTGNGLSKYLTKKYLNDDWLIRALSFQEIRTLSLKRYKLVSMQKRNLLITKWGEKGNNYNEKIESYANDVQANINFINSEKFIPFLIAPIESFAIMQALFVKKLPEFLNKRKRINGPEFFQWIEEIKKEEGYKEIKFNSKDRNFLFHSFLNTYVNDLFYNVEVFLTCLDKAYEKEQNSIIKNIDLNFIYNYMLPESYIEYVWNKGKINSIEIKNYIKTTGKVFTLNYDNITRQIFEKAIHLHGQFDECIDRFAKKSLIVKLIKGNYYAQIFPMATSVILKGPDYKMGHMMRIASKATVEYKRKMKLLSETKGDFLIIGTLIKGDPHIFDLLGNKKRKIYITYYDEEEFLALNTLIDFGRKIDRKCEIFLVNFQELMTYLNL